MSNDKPKKIQVQRRVKKITAPCDKLCNQIFNYPADEYAEIIEYGDRCDCVEVVKKKGRKEIITPYWLELVEGFEDKLPPDKFTREVLFHAMNFFEQGIRIITPSMILDSMTGGEEKRNVYKEQYAAIKAALDKLGFTRIKINLAPLFAACPKYAANFKGDRSRAELVGILLPMRYLETEINGHKTLAIELLSESPLMTVAKLKKQLLKYDLTPLAISGQHNTAQVITVKNWLLRRIELIKQRKQNPSILFKTLYEECGLTDATKRQKQETRKVIDDILNSFKADGVIHNFEFEKQGIAYRNIKIYL